VLTVVLICHTALNAIPRMGLHTSERRCDDA
jgi:hypothetical protein